MGIESDYDYTPQMYRRIVFVSAQSASFSDAAKTLEEVGELKLAPKRLWRATQRIGQERVNECRTAADRYVALPLPSQQESPVSPVPRVACVQMDGGRFQQRARHAANAADTELAEQAATAASDDSSENGFWREYKAGVLMSMVSDEHAVDPCPDLPATFRDPGKMREMAREIKGFTHESPVLLDTDESVELDSEDRDGRPKNLVRTVVATSGDVEEFGPLLAAAAHARGFHAAPRKAFVADGSATNWGVWRTYFSHYTPILDFVHALMYVYAAALAGCLPQEGWSRYCHWAQWLWGGQIDSLIAALGQRQQELGVPEPHEKGTPRAQVAASLKYLTNQRSRMKYDEYRRRGLPLTSSLIESTIKQINRRVKGTEKFWSAGADPMLHLVADQLSDTNVVTDFWSRRVARLVSSATYQQAT